MAYYSGNIDSIKKFMRIINVGTGRADNFETGDIESYQADADREIDARLRAVIAVPVIQITRDSVVDYPDPIPLIAKQLTAALIIENELGQTQPDLSALGVQQKTNALDKLNELIAGISGGTQRLEGQRIKSRNRFVRPTVHPLNVPATGTVPVTGV